MSKITNRDNANNRRKGGASPKLRLGIISVAYLLLILTVAWFAENSKQRAAAEVSRLALASSESQAMSTLRGQVSELQRNLLVFRLTGNASVKTRIDRLYDDLLQYQRELQVEILDDARQNILQRMQGHIDAYYENFEILVENREQIDTLLNETLDTRSNRVTELLDDAARAAGADGGFSAEMTQSFARLLDGLSEFVADPDSARNTAMKGYIEQLLRLVDRLPNATAALQAELRHSLTGIEKDLGMLLQLKRGDSYLANVVIAGSANEILRLADELVDITTARLQNARILADEEIEQARRTDLLVLFMAVAFALGLIWLMNNAIRRLANAEADLRESRERFRATFDQAAVGIAHVGTDGRFLRVNGRLCEILAYPADELQLLTFQEITHTDDLDADLGQLQSVLEGKTDKYSIEKRYHRGDGTQVWAELTVSLVHNELGEPDYFISVIDDISQRHLSDEKLKQSREALARSNAELQQFAYVASHDLQEPLRMISSYLQLLEKRYKDQLGDDAQEFIAYAVDGALRMKSLINDLLHLSRVDSRGKPPVQLDMETALSNAMRNLEVAIDDCAATITHDSMPTLNGDSGQLEQLLQNLIGNAIKYRGEAAPVIDISVTRIAEAAVTIPGEAPIDGWLFAVKDNGIGVLPEYADEVFKIFRRLHTTEEHSGTGIGLAICRKIVERHGGTIWVESTGNGGSTFYFTIADIEAAAQTGQDPL